MKNNLIILSMVMFSVGCTSTNEYPISGSYAKINEMMILDPMAPENNDGIVNELDGAYGEKVVESYRASSSTPSEGKTSSGESLVSGSGSGTGK